MKHSKLLLLVSLVLCIKLGVAQKRNKCPNMQLVRCSNQFQGVCAFFKDDSCKDLSQKYSANTCIACMDSRVKYVVDGPCNGDKVFCDANIRPEFCTREYFPVCGYNSKCKGDNCGIPAGNKCMACANSEIEWYVQGECPQGDETGDDNNSDDNTNDDDSDNNDNEVTCDPDNRPEVCTDIYAPVCATTSECDDDHCYLTTHTAGNACYACGDDKVISYVSGECPPAATRCDPRNRPEVCDLVYAPVCATLQTCNRRECTETNETFGNDCLACGNPDVISHIPGECPEV